MNRRQMLGALGSALMVTGDAGAQSATAGRITRKGRIRQVLFTRCFASGPGGPKMSLEEMLQTGERLGAVGFDMLPPAQWPDLKKHGMIPAMGSGGGVSIENGIIHRELHDEMAKSVPAFVNVCAAGGCPTMLIAGGQRKGLSYKEGADNAVEFLKRVKDHAEEKQVTLCIEIMNDKYQNPAIGRVDQVGTHLSWIADVCARVNSPRVKILFDIYHVQIMDGNVIENIRTYFPVIGHFHTAGVPGRHELDENQELNYPHIFRTIADLGYTGTVAHEYDPAPGHDPVQILEKVMALADV